MNLHLDFNTIITKKFKLKTMKKIILTLSIALGLTQIIKAQVITAVPCDMLGMSVNVGSSTNSISIYHSGQYMTHPRENNIFSWEFTDQIGNILHQDTIVNDAFCNFSHNWSLTDTINVTVHLVNDSANLDAWYTNQGLPLNGNSINCLFTDQLYWSTGASTPWGSWTFIHGNPGVDQNVVLTVGDFSYQKKKLVKIVDILGRETSFKNNNILIYIYSDGSTEKKYFYK